MMANDIHLSSRDQLTQKLVPSIGQSMTFNNDQNLNRSASYDII